MTQEKLMTTHEAVASLRIRPEMLANGRASGTGPRCTQARERNPFSHHFPIIGKRLYRLAVVWSRRPPATIKEAREIVKGIKGRKAIVNGSRSVEAARLAVTEAAQEIRNARNVGRRWHRAARCVPEQPVLTRLHALRERTFRSVLEIAPYRFDTPPKIHLTDHVEEVGVSQSSYLDWDYYSKATRYPKKVVETTITIPAGWRRRVQAQGIALIGGLLTLDAELIRDDTNVRTFAAAWLAHGRGYHLSVVEGFIAVGEGEAYHASTLKKAVSGLARKLRHKVQTAGTTDSLSAAKLSRLVDAHPRLYVTLNDAQTAGACDEGIRQWCLSVGLDYEARRATLRDVYRAYQRYPMREARAAMLVALRKRRRTVAKPVEAGKASCPA